MADSVDEIIDEKIDDAVETEVEGGSDTTVVVVESGDDSASGNLADVLDAANQIQEIAQEEAQSAASDAVQLSMAIFQEEMGRYPTREEVAQMVAEAVAGAVVAAQPTMEAAADIQDEMPPAGAAHWFYRPLRRNR